MKHIAELHECQKRGGYQRLPWKAKKEAMEEKLIEL